MSDISKKRNDIIFKPRLEDLPESPFSKTLYKTLIRKEKQ